MKVKVEGMSCNHCVKSVERALKALNGVNDVIVDLKEGTAKIEGNVDVKEVEKAIEETGFEFKGEI